MLSTAMRKRPAELLSADAGHDSNVRIFHDGDDRDTCRALADPSRRRPTPQRQ